MNDDLYRIGNPEQYIKPGVILKHEVAIAYRFYNLYDNLHDAYLGVGVHTVAVEQKFILFKIVEINSGNVYFKLILNGRVYYWSIIYNIILNYIKRGVLTVVKDDNESVQV
jgi:hypothetical protein